MAAPRTRSIVPNGSIENSCPRLMSRKNETAEASGNVNRILPPLSPHEWDGETESKLRGSCTVSAIRSNRPSTRSVSIHYILHQLIYLPRTELGSDQISMEPSPHPSINHDQDQFQNPDHEMKSSQSESTSLLMAAKSAGAAPGALASHDESYSLFSTVFFVIGCASAGPYKAFTSAVDYFAYKFPNYHVLFLIQIAYSLPSVPTLIYMVKSGYRFSYDVRIYVFLTLAFLSLAMVPIVDAARPRDCPIALSLMLFAVFLSGISAGVLYPSFFGLASSFPRTSTVYMMTGLGLAGLWLIGVRIVTKVSMDNSEQSVRTSSYYYFAIAALSVALAIAAYALLKKARRSQPYLDDLEQRSQQGGAANKTSYSSIHSRVWLVGLALCVNMIITSACFPGLVAEIKSTDPALNKTKWFSIFCVLCFVIGDSAGRFSPYFVKNIAQKFTDGRLLLLVFARVIFFGLFWICIQPRIIQSDPLVYLIVVAFSLSNGVAVSGCSAAGPYRVETPAEKRLAGTFMSLCLNLGIFLGSLLAVGLLYEITGEVPW